MLSLELKIEGASTLMDEFKLCLLEERTERGGFYLRYEFFTIDVLLLLSRGGAFNVTTKEESSEPCGGC